MVDVFLLINCTGGHEKQVISDLQKLPVEICPTFGIFDFVCKIQGKDMASVEKNIQNIRKIQHITSTNTVHTIPEQE
ncbi:MAG: Lrp/AsnC ligand binding domain-containing protein [Nitrosopumilus sp.]|nr:Lrp/AsnC ligand binding domain-containing protein [Nitrosopumilus sp.]MDH3565161.1 Lrp/AsnC ligand binding domain-containing protein [Nitrosopumilus sp.]MDH5416877.1 Lrp/AsnC ligand binding domain-containing protein [Nitrosopumilus sp.]